MTKKAYTLDEAIAALPIWFDSLDEDIHTDIDSLAYTVLCDIDMHEEGQDCTEHIQPKVLLRWLKKFAPHALAKR
jgi:hypothetical protein